MEIEIEYVTDSVAKALANRIRKQEEIKKEIKEKYSDYMDVNSMSNILHVLEHEQGDLLDIIAELGCENLYSKTKEAIN